MKTRLVIYVTILLACFSAVAQQALPSGKAADAGKHMEGARELFYLAVEPKDSLPPIRKIAQPRTNPPAQTAQPSFANDGPGAVHLGLRYNLLLVDQQTNKAKNVDPDRVLRHGECFALEFETNRSGYLYVLARQSSGAWQPLIPSAEMVSETNIIDPGKPVRVPKGFCFEVGDPPGSETLFVVLSRDPRDFYELYDGIKRQNGPPPAGKPGNQVQYASISVDSTVKHMAQQFGTRDIAIRKVSQPLASQEPPNSVYVVNTSLRPSSSVVTQIEVKHQ